MRSIGASETTILNNYSTLTGRVRARVRVKIKDNVGTYQTYTSEIQTVKIRRRKDEPVATAEIEMLYRNGTNLSPYANASDPIDFSRDCQIEAAYLDSSYNPITWHLLFDGFIQSLDVSDPQVMKLECRDNFGKLMDRYTESEQTYGGGSRVDTVIQTVLTAWMSPTVTLYVPVAPGAGDTVANYKQAEAPVGEIIRRLALRKAWDISYRYDSGTTSYRLTFIDPARSNTTSTYTFTKNMFRGISGWTIDRSNIRNKVEVAYSTGSTRGSVTASDSTSITKHGTLYMRIGEDQGLRFDNSTQAQNFANAIVSDLANPFLDTKYEVCFFPFAELNDIYTFNATNKGYDTAQVFAVVGFEHSFDATTDSRDSLASTTFELRGKPVGGIGVYDPIGNKPTDPTSGTVTPPDAPTGLGGNFTTKDAVISWNPVTNAAEYEVVVKNTTGGATRRTETVAASQNPGYSYSWEKNKIDGTVQPSLTFEVRAIRSSTQGQLRSSAATVALANAAPSAPTGLALTNKPPDILASVNTSTEGDIDYLEIQADDNSGFSSPNTYKTYSIANITIGPETTSASGATYVRARWVDIFGQAGTWSSTSSLVYAPITAGYLSFLLGGINLLKNPGLDYDLDGNSIADDWTIYEAGGVSGTTYSMPTGGVLGSAYQRLTNTINSAGKRLGVKQTVGNNSGIVPSRSYVLTAFLQGTVASGCNVVFYIDWKNSGGTIIGTSSGVVTTSLSAGSFGRYLLNASSPASASQVDVYIWVEYGSGAGGSCTLDIDAVMLEAGEIPTFYQPSMIANNIGAKELRALDLSAIQGTFGGGASKSAIDSRGLRIYDSGSTLRAAVGDIGGLSWGSGSLSAGTYGFYGAGSNVYLVDYPRLIKAATLTETISIGTVNANTDSNGNTVISSETTFTSYTIANGRYLRPFVDVRFTNLTGGLVLRGFEYYAEVWNGSAWVIANLLTNSSITKVRVQAIADVRNVTGSNIASASVEARISVILMESPN